MSYFNIILSISQWVDKMREGNQRLVIPTNVKKSTLKYKYISKKGVMNRYDQLAPTSKYLPAPLSSDSTQSKRFSTS